MPFAITSTYIATVKHHVFTACDPYPLCVHDAPSSSSTRFVERPPPPVNPKRASLSNTTASRSYGALNYAHAPSPTRVAKKGPLLVLPVAIKMGLVYPHGLSGVGTDVQGASREPLYIRSSCRNFEALSSVQTDMTPKITTQTGDHPGVVVMATNESPESVANVLFVLSTDPRARQTTVTVFHLFSMTFDPAWLRACSPVPWAGREGKGDPTMQRGVWGRMRGFLRAAKARRGLASTVRNRCCC
ncbi:hypothetical protein EDB86DRAFT_1407060 [Lactarius hatsudake]|nr:hypothetical protein EDB86DRAFT_1407060 [Lactarius hatsudake]